jgi:transcriptional regulator with XRE-family HTH domain
MTRPLAELLRDLRHQQGASLRAAARDLGVDPAHLSRLERGAKTPSRGLLTRASKYYTVPVEDLERARGDIPEDIRQLLLDRPELVQELRAKYGSR